MGRYVMKLMQEAAPPSLLGGCALALLLALPAHAQQITGTPGSPSATTTIDGTQIPPPPQKFGGTIERTTQGRAQRAVDHDRRLRIRGPQHVRRGDPDFFARPHGRHWHLQPFPTRRG